MQDLRDAAVNEAERATTQARSAEAMREDAGPDLELWLDVRSSLALEEGLGQQAEVTTGPGKGRMMFEFSAQYGGPYAAWAIVAQVQAGGWQVEYSYAVDEEVCEAVATLREMDRSMLSDEEWRDARRGRRG